MQEKKISSFKPTPPDASSPSVIGTISLSKDSPVLSGYHTRLTILHPPSGLKQGVNDQVYFDSWELTPDGKSADEPKQPGTQYLEIIIADYNHNGTEVYLEGSTNLPNPLKMGEEGHFYDVNVYVKKDGQFHQAGNQVQVDVGPITHS